MVGDSETEAFWSQFLRHLRERGLTGVRLVISESHSGLVKAIRKVRIGAAWQCCRVHFVRSVFFVIPKGSAETVAATIRTLFTQPTAEAVRTHLGTVADMLGCQFPKVKDMLLEAKEDLTAFADFPHQSSTTNGSSSPAATSPPKAWTASIQTPEPACPAPPSDQLHHHKGHDPTLLPCCSVGFLAWLLDVPYALGEWVAMKSSP